MWPIVHAMSPPSPCRHSSTWRSMASSANRSSSVALALWTHMSSASYAVMPIFQQLDAGDADITLHSQVVNHPQITRNRHLGVVRHRPPGRNTLLFSTDV